CPAGPPYYTAPPPRGRPPPATAPAPRRQSMSVSWRYPQSVKGFVSVEPEGRSASLLWEGFPPLFRASRLAGGRGGGRGGPAAPAAEVGEQGHRSVKESPRYAPPPQEQRHQGVGEPVHPAALARPQQKDGGWATQGDEYEGDTVLEHHQP